MRLLEELVKFKTKTVYNNFMQITPSGTHTPVETMGSVNKIIRKLTDSKLLKDVSLLVTMANILILLIKCKR